MSTGRPNLSGSALTPPDDLAAIAEWFETQEDARRRFGFVFRDALDGIIDGHHTGRWHYDHLSKTEKTHLGTTVEITLAKEFDIEDGDCIDWCVAGQDLDCKFSKTMFGWEFPLEMYVSGYLGLRSGVKNHPALVTWMCDDTGEWAAGLIRISDTALAFRANGLPAFNGDNKRVIAADRRGDVYWLFGGVQTDLPENTLLNMTEDVRGKILNGDLSGQGRMTVLFREHQQRLIGRSTVYTVGQQDDSPKRARDSRKALAKEGIAVLGHQEGHPDLAAALGLPVCEKGEWLSATLIEVPSASPRQKGWHRGRWWTIAGPGDEVAPLADFYTTRSGTAS